MSKEPALRRSRRSTQPKKTSTYSVGDIVEIVRNGVTLEGRIAYKLSEGTTPNPRWLVTFDEQPHKDEEVYEKAFGKLLKGVEDDLPATPVSAPPRRIRPVINTSIPPPDNNNAKKTPSNSGSSEPDTPEKNSVVFSEEGSPHHSDESSAAQKKRASSREQRSRRRQAKIDDHPELVQIDGAPPRHNNINNILNNTKRNKKRQRRDASSSKNPKRAKTLTTEDGQEVVKVKLLTGTLYLYRGLNRRAEFVRRF